jgi:uncharacterized protein with HEPN domain
MLRDREYLLDMLAAARLILSYVAGKTKAEFLADIQCQDAVIRRFEIIGEAARRLSDQTRATLPQLPWDAMIGMRNLLIHEYDGVDLSVVWETIRTDLPTLTKAMESLVPPEDESET